MGRHGSCVTGVPDAPLTHSRASAAGRPPQAVAQRVAAGARSAPVGSPGHVSRRTSRSASLRPSLRSALGSESDRVASQLVSFHDVVRGRGTTAPNTVEDALRSDGGWDFASLDLAEELG